MTTLYLVIDSGYLIGRGIPFENITEPLGIFKTINEAKEYAYNCLMEDEDEEKHFRKWYEGSLKKFIMEDEKSLEYLTDRCYDIYMK